MREDLKRKSIKSKLPSSKDRYAKTGKSHYGDKATIVSSRPVFDHLVQRFETPDPQNRWDSPFFSVLAGEELDLGGIYNSLFFNKAPKKNMSTQSVRSVEIL